MAINIESLPTQQELSFEIEDVRMLEDSQEDMRIKKLCKQIRLALHLVSEVTKKIKEKTP